MSSFEFGPPVAIDHHEVPMTIRRMKTYTGGQGYVYQYYFVGKRPAQNTKTPSTE